MSRIGRHPIAIPAGVTVTVSDDNHVVVKGPKGQLEQTVNKNITVKGMNPAFVGPYLFEAVEENHMYKVPHMHTHEQIRARHRRIESDLEREEALHEKYAPLQKY